MHVAIIFIAMLVISSVIIMLNTVVSVLLELVNKITILEYQRGLKYKDGVFMEILSPGRYTFFGNRVKILFVDMRKRYVFFPDQKMCTKEGVLVRINLRVVYQVIDPDLAVNNFQSHERVLYSILQDFLYQQISKLSLKRLIREKDDLINSMLPKIKNKMIELGLEIFELSIQFDSIDSINFNKNNKNQ